MSYVQHLESLMITLQQLPPPGPHEDGPMITIRGPYDLVQSLIKKDDGTYEYLSQDRGRQHRERVDSNWIETLLQSLRTLNPDSLEFFYQEREICRFIYSSKKHRLSEREESSSKKSRLMHR